MKSLRVLMDPGSPSAALFSLERVKCIVRYSFVGMRSVIVLLVALLPNALAIQYSIDDSYVGTDFLSAFVHEAIDDPSHGRVNYVNESTALAENLTYANGDTLIMRADYWTVLDPDGPGRDSVRIRSLKTYTQHAIIFDIRHMPQGCGTWPAAWEVNGTEWPSGGEVDILEGVNDVSPDQITLHTNPGCTMPSGLNMTGTPGNTDCEGSDGCGVQAPTQNSYGPPFNENGGGWYAMERTDDFIRVWFFPRDGDVPSDVSNSSSTIDTDNWGEPTAYFPNTQCDIVDMFSGENIVINLTFCGDWAGTVYSSSGCPGDCVDYVNENPSAFVNAYWDIASCLDVQNADFENGTAVQIYDCNGTGAQNWIISTGTTAIQVAGTNYCLDAGDSPASGTQMKIWECYSGLAAQTWEYTADDQIELQGQGLRQCLDLTNGDDADGTVMQIWACSDGDTNQIWTLS
ncbi:hypothetical protein NM688_g7492 [Phlebia brevispora]|uniref:Uncharacterized protein n=1 Tax=Phlebia brevispora TaxID=194682 RepID=A0ACC1S4Q0_9APHY|nr:hypothetical protein NM688_g7492 [Phlebia brevispora]